MFNLHPDHPQRPVAWRWERARLLKERFNRVPGKIHDDSYVTQARNFQIAMTRCRNDYDRYAVMNKFSSLSIAYDIWDSGSNRCSSLMRHEIEARILTQQPIEEIADKLGINKKIIITYSKTFFDVTERLNNSSYIVHQVFGPALHRSIQEKDVHLLWKIYGYFTKSIPLVDALVSTFTNNSIPDPNNLDSYLVTDSKSCVRRKTALAARMVALNNFVQERLLDMQNRIQEREATVEGISTTNGDTYISNIQAYLENVPWKVNDSKDAVKLNAELRADEQLKLYVTGQKPTEDLSVYKIPTEARKDGK